MRCHQPGLPPLVIGSVDHVEDVAVREAQPLAGQAAVPRPVVVEQSSAKRKTKKKPSVLGILVINWKMGKTQRAEFKKTEISISSTLNGFSNGLGEITQINFPIHLGYMWVILDFLPL